MLLILPYFSCRTDFQSGSFYISKKAKATCGLFLLMFVYLVLKRDEGNKELEKCTLDFV